MSDGPHRSLPMRNGWKKLAERGDGKLHTPEQVSAAVPLALADDWKEERCDGFMKGVKNILLEGDQNTLFKPSKQETIDALRNLPGSGYPLRAMLRDALVQAVDDGHNGEAALVKGTADGLAIRCSAGARQVEEHYLLKSNENRATHVRGRIEDGAFRSDFDAMARSFCNLNKASSPSAINKYDSLDDGVPHP
ncbi:MAG: hypothetical protein IT539_01440 [Bradyrhizobiaceae bacterium]|nr:hypothetical protein [Bradyrhizobiaceae bacterium]